MKTSKLYVAGLMLSTATLTLSCSKNNDGSDLPADKLQEQILSDVATNVCEASYVDIYNKSVALQGAITTLNGATTDENLESARAAWKNVRVTWERSEAWSFGPVETDNIGPRIDTWPVNPDDLDDILANDETFNEDYINGLDEELKGFHPIEYLLWGEDGNKSATAFTAREKDYLLALVTNLVSLTKGAKEAWENGYTQQLANAGNGSTEFNTKQEAFFQLIGGMVAICDEVANGKITEPFKNEDPSLEESPFAKNSFTDFINNINGVLLMYQGKLTTDGKGLEDLVIANNPSLDAEIKSKHAAAIAALEAFGDVPFGTAITTRQSDVQNAIDKINDLATTLDVSLGDLVEEVAN